MIKDNKKGAAALVWPIRDTDASSSESGTQTLSHREDGGVDPLPKLLANKNNAECASACIRKNFG
jgi:hypothetical protein